MVLASFYEFGGVLVSFVRVSASFASSVEFLFLRVVASFS